MLQCPGLSAWHRQSPQHYHIIICWGFVSPGLSWSPGHEPPSDVKQNPGPVPGLGAAGTLASLCKLSKNCHPNIHIISIQFLVDPSSGAQPELETSIGISDLFS